MNVPEALKLVRQYIFDLKGRRVRTDERYIRSNERQLEMLKSAVDVAVKHYRAKKDAN